MFNALTPIKSCKDKQNFRAKQIFNAKFKMQNSKWQSGFTLNGKEWQRMASAIKDC